MKFKTLTFITAVSMSMSITANSNYGYTNQGTGLYDKVFYQIGGGPAVMPAPARKRPNEVVLGVGWSSNLMCGNFDVKTTVKNQLNGLTEGFKDLMGNIIQSATGAVASMPAMIIQRSNPQLYDLLTNGVLQGRLDFDSLKTSCEELSNKAADYMADAGWNMMARSQNYHDIGKNGESDAVTAKKRMEKDDGKKGIPWIGGEKKGGLNQDGISVISDVLTAGFNMMTGQSVTNQSAVSDCDGLLCTTWKTPKDAAEWGVKVLGESVKRTCTDCGESKSQPGMGLAPLIEDENIAVLTEFEKVLNKKNPSNADLASIGSTQIPITRGLLEALRDDPDVQLLATRLGHEIAISRTLEKALLLRRTMLAGMREPNVANNKEALEVLEKQLTALDREIEQVEMEIRLQRQLTGNTALATLEKRATDRQKSLQNNSTVDNDLRAKKITGSIDDAQSDNSNNGNFSIEDKQIKLPIPQKSSLNGLNGAWTPIPGGSGGNGGSSGGSYSSIPPISGSALDQTTGLLRQFEGFSGKAYWDVNAYRTGYGSDTITKADGTVVKVTKDTIVTKEDAERDLARRTKEFANTARRDVSAATWDKLPPNVQAALTSVAYNYGSLSRLDSVVKAAQASAQSGDMRGLADAVRMLQSHNNGVNAKRRNQEADYILGGG